MKALKYILFLLLIVIIGLSIYVAVQPNNFEVERSRTINAPTAVIYNNVIDFKNWEAWNSWKDEDPSIVMTMSDKTKGIDGSYSWTNEDGTGTMKTTNAVINKSITQEMQFGDLPKSDVTWTFSPKKDGSTEVTWNIKGQDLPFDFKAFSTFMGGMEKQIGPHYERGLQLLDNVIQKDMARYSVEIEGVTEHGGGFYMYKTTSATGANISQIMGKQYGKIMSYMAKNNILQNGMPFTIYNEMSPNGNVIMSNAIPVQNKVEVPKESEILCGYIPKTSVVKASLKGNYTYLGEAWKKAMEYVAEIKVEQSELKPFEIYTNDPGSFPNPADWKTDIYIPIKTNNEIISSH